MKQEFDNNCHNIVIIGGGPAGVMCAIQAANNPNNKITIIEQKTLLHTILKTGGGRCNITNFKVDNKLLASNYPRGEKFLYSPFSKFNAMSSMAFFQGLGIKLKVEESDRVFPKSDTAKEVQEVLTEKIMKTSNIKVVKARVFDLQKIGKKYIVDVFKGNMSADAVVIATGANEAGYRLAKISGHKIVEPKPSLCPLTVLETQFYTLPGVSIQDVPAKVICNEKIIHKVSGDILFTHTSLSGPLFLKISALCALLEFSNNNPLQVEVNFVKQNFEQFREKLKKDIHKSPKKDIINICSNYTTRYLAALLIEECGLQTNMNSSEVSNIKLNELVEKLTSYTFNITGRKSQEAIVTAGGVLLSEIDNRDMQSKKWPHIYFCGEIIDVDGFCGGFNLQNCWTTGFIAGKALQRLKN